MILGLLVALIWGVTAWVNSRFSHPLALGAYKQSRSKAQLFALLCMVSAVLMATFAPWPSLPRMIIGGILCGLGSAINAMALRDNPFFSPAIIQPPHRIRDGVYKYLEHPGYLGFSIRFLGLTYWINTPLAIAIFCVYSAFLGVRVIMENRVLRGM